MEHHAGIDVSLELSSVCVVDARGKRWSCGGGYLQVGGGRSEPHHEVEGGRSTVRADTEENVGHDGYPTDPNHPFNRAR